MESRGSVASRGPMESRGTHVPWGSHYKMVTLELGGGPPTEGDTASVIPPSTAAGPRFEKDRLGGLVDGAIFFFIFFSFIRRNRMLFRLLPIQSFADEVF